MRPLGVPTAAQPHRAKPDPAPSRVAYRAHRLWLTPMVRSFVRVGLPMFVAAFAFGFVAKDPRVIATVEAKRAEMYRAIADRPEFLVHTLRIDGASQALADDVRVVLALDLPTSRFDLDVPKLQTRIAELDPVAEVTLAIKPGGVLVAEMRERVAAVVWQSPDGDLVLDATGRRVARLGDDAPPLLDVVRLKLPHLPILAGPGADLAVPEALALLESAAPIRPRVLGLVRMGERRWDMVLTDGMRVLLPEQGAVQALDRVLAAQSAESLLDRAVTAVDLRNPARPTVRLTEPALDRLWQIRDRAQTVGALE